MIRAVFFDLGGTLLVTRRDRILHGVLVKAGYDVTLESVRAAYGAAEPPWLEYYAGHPVVGEGSAEAYRRLYSAVVEHLGIARGAEGGRRIAALVREHWAGISETVPNELYSDAEPVLAELGELGVTTALVSNAPPEIARTVEELGLPRFIRHIIISGVVGYSKPNPEIFRIALARAEARPDQTIHIGDVYPSDIVGARNAGVRGVLLDRDGVSDAKDCLTIRSLSEVPPLIASDQ